MCVANDENRGSGNDKVSAIRRVRLSAPDVQVHQDLVLVYVLIVGFHSCNSRRLRTQATMQICERVWSIFNLTKNMKQAEKR